MLKLWKQFVASLTTPSGTILGEWLNGLTEHVTHAHTHNVHVTCESQPFRCLSRVTSP